MQGDQRLAVDRHRSRQIPILAFQHELSLIARQAIEVGAVERREGLQSA